MQGEQLKLNLDYMMMQQHLTAVHDGDDGYIALCKIDGNGAFQQHHYLYPDLIRELEFLGIDGKNNYYFSVNSFYKPERRVENVRQLRSLYADIDCHDLTNKQAARTINKTIKHLKLPDVEEQIPSASMMVSTGRGLHLYWLIEDLPKMDVPLWQLIQDAITVRLAEVTTELDVTVDNVGDITRVLRLAGTNNTKPNAMATLIMQSPTLYRLDGFIDDYFPELNTLGKPRKKNASESDQIGKLQYIYNVYSLHYTRLLDLVTLLELRKGQVGSDECRRRMVFLYRYWGCCYLKDPERALADALAFNQSFTIPLPESTVISATKSAEKAYSEWLSGETTIYNGQAKRKGYNYRNDTLIRWLDITPEEQRKLKTIIGKEEKYRRNNARRTGRDETGLTAKQRSRKERDQRIMELYVQGLSYREIGRMLNTSKDAIYRVVNKLSRF